MFMERVLGHSRNLERRTCTPGSSTSNGVGILLGVSQGVQQVQEYGFQEVKRAQQVLVLDRIDLPWLPSDEAHVPLAFIVLQSGEQFYYGSAVKGKTLIDAARGLDTKSEQANKLFYAEAQRFLQGSRATRTLDNPLTKASNIQVDRRRDIYYASNGVGTIRTYFMRMNDIDNKPVIIRIATCVGKGTEIDVLSVLTTEDKKTIKKRCLGK